MGRKRTPKKPLKPVVIINPVAGSGVGHDLFRHAEHDLLDVLGDMDVHFTNARGDAEALTAEALNEGPRDIIVVGGDGTLNEVVNGWFDDAGHQRAPEARLVPLAGGTGSDFVRSLGINSAADTCHALRTNSSRRIDVGCVVCKSIEGGDDVERRYVNIASFGLSSMANQEVSRFSAVGGRLAYAAATAMSLIGWSNPAIQLTYTTYDGRHLRYESPAVMGAFANGRFFGGGMKVAPDAQLDDGLIDVVMVGDLRRRDILRLARHLYDGSHIAHSSVTTMRAKTVEVIGPSSTLIETDGDAVGRLPASFTLQREAITVVCP